MMMSGMTRELWAEVTVWKTGIGCMRKPLKALKGCPGGRKEKAGATPPLLLDRPAERHGDGPGEGKASTAHPGENNEPRREKMSKVKQIAPNGSFNATVHGESFNFQFTGEYSPGTYSYEVFRETTDCNVFSGRAYGRNEAAVVNRWSEVLDARADYN